MTEDLIFPYEHNDIRINFKFSHSKQATLKWSAFAGCFFVAQWQSIQAAWGPNGSLASLWITASDCTALWLNKDVCCAFHFISAYLKT